MWAPHTLPSQQLKLHNILNMEHPSLSHKNYMVDVTAVGGCYCAQRRFTGNTYIHHLCHRGLARGQAHMVSNGTGNIIVKPVDFCCLVWICISGKLRIIYQVALELHCSYITNCKNCKSTQLKLVPVSSVYNSNSFNCLLIIYSRIL